MELHNLMEIEVKHTLNHIINTTSSVDCQCGQCKLDITAITLNSLPPKYIVTEKGLLYSRVANMNLQFDTDVIAALTRAINHVNHNPRH